MRHNLLLALILALLLCFSLNFFYHHDLLISLLNSLTLTLSIYLFKENLPSQSRLTLFFIVALSTIPLFNFKPSNPLIAFLPFLLTGILYLYLHFQNQWIVLFLTIFLFIGTSFAGEIIKPPLIIQSSQLIFNSPEINYHIKRHQQDALYIPFKLRQLVYSNSVFVYAGLTNLFDFLNLKNLSDILLSANLYPLFLGFYKLSKRKDDLTKISVISFIVALFVSSLDRSPDKFYSLYLLGPIFISLIILGTQNINKKLYLALFALSIFILISPKI